MGDVKHQIVVDRVREQIEKWAQELIDLTRRNRSLYYRPTKRTTLEIVAPAPDTAYRSLLEGEAFTFFSPPPPIDGRPWSVDDGVALRGDRELLTKRTDEQDLDRTLKALARQSEQDLMDRGVQTLYAAFGMLKWREARGEDGLVRSPLLYVPVSLSRSSPRDPFVLELAPEDVVLNPSLVVKLSADYGLDLRTVADVAGETDDLEDICSSVRAVCADRGWDVVSTMVLTRSTFHKESMYRDLLDNIDVIAQHPLVRSLAGDKAAQEAVATGELPAEQDVDELAPPEEARTILDADASQRRAIVAAQQGASFVMDGPPGTGKSQTIANMIAELIATRKKVLFVSEKAAALDVVADRLRSRGIDDFILELHSHKSSRKEVVQQLDRSLRHHVTARSRLSAADRARAETRRRELTGYASAVNETRDPLGRSVAWVAGRLAQLASAPPLPAADSIDRTLEASQLDRMLQAAERLSRVWQPVEDEDFLWRGFSGSFLRLGEREQLLSDLEEATSAVEDLRSSADELAYELGMDAVQRRSCVDRLLRVADHLDGQPGTPPAWWVRPDLDVVERRLGELGRQLDRLDAADAHLSERYHSHGDFDPPLKAREVRALIRDLVAAAPGFAPAKQLSLEEAKALHAGLAHLEEVVRRIRGDAAHVCQAIGAEPRNLSLGQLQRIASVARRAGETVRPEPDWLQPGIAQRVQRAVDLLRPLQEQHDAQLKAVSETFTEGVLELDLKTIRVRVGQATGLRKLGRTYREAKAELRPVTRSGRVDRSVLEQLDSAAEAKETRALLDQEEQTYAELLGAFYAARKTDARAVEEALALLTAVVDELAAVGDRKALASQFAGPAPADRELPTVSERLLTDLAALAGLRDQLGLFGAESWLQRTPDDLAASIAQIQPLLASLVSLLAVVEPARRVLCSADAIVEDLDRLEEARGVRAHLRATEATDKDLLEEGYHGEKTDVPAAMQALAWTRTLRDLLGGPATRGHVERCHTYTGRRVDDGAVRQALARCCEASTTVLDRFEPWRRAEVEDLIKVDFDTEVAVLGELADRIDDIDIWCEHRDLLCELESDGLQEALVDARERRLLADQVSGALERAVLSSWIEDILENDQRLATIRSSERDVLVQEFADLDEQLISDAAEQVIAACNGSRPRTSLGGASVIQREAQKRRRHMPVRRLLSETVEVSTAIKPCFMMSPLSVSQFLPSDWTFDVVIFDEASQITPADAINCVYRGQQLIIAGDDRQLPPTSFFEASMDDDDAYEEEQFEEFESVLGLCKGSELLDDIPLRWHYRSRHEDLITFSNYRFYDGQLITYPGADVARSDLGVELHVVDGVYRRGGRRDNPREAAALADRVLHHAVEHPDLSLGVVALSSAQAEAIEDAIDRRRAEHPKLDEYFTAGRLDGFFVKNLENVQGDERDIILLSVGYGPDEVGKFTMNFGPINREGGERRLNVAVTRARRRVEVFASFEPEQMRLGDSKSRGLRELQRYLAYLESGHAALAVDLAGSQGDVESPFEEEVMRTVASWGYEVMPQVGSAGYRVDLGVRDPSVPGRYVLGIECDGAAYHSSRVARDRDRLRQQVLEGLGWTLHRVWGPSWYRNRASAEEELREALEMAIAGRRRRPNRTGRAGTQSLARAVEVVDLSAPPNWASYYQLAAVRPSTRDRADSPRGLGELHHLVGRIVKVESPVHREVVGRRIATAFGHNLTRRTQAAVDAAIDSLASRGELWTQDDIVWSSDQVQVRVPREGNAASRRDARHIPPAEAEAAVFHLLEDARSAGRDELLDAVKQLFGWARMGPQIASALEKALASLIASGRVQEGTDGRLRVAV